MQETNGGANDWISYSRFYWAWHISVCRISCTERESMMTENSNDPSNKKYWDAHLLAEAAQKAPKGSATRRGLWNAFSKKAMTAEAMRLIEKELESKGEGKSK